MNRIAVVDYLRGLASLAVAWFHLTNTYDEGPVRASGSYGWLDVEVFFVISGFVIPYSISRIFHNYSLRDFPEYMLRRVTRIEPPYVVSLVLVIILGYLSAMAPGFQGLQPDYSFGRVVSHLFYAAPLFGLDWMQPVYWTLACEFVFYLVIGCLFPLLFHRRGIWYLWLATALLAVAVLSGGMNPIVLLFVMGLVLYSHAHPDVRSSLINVMGILICAVIIMVIAGRWIEAAVGLSTIAVIYYLRDLRLASRSGGVLAWLAAISYSLYLLHIPIGGRVVNLGRRFIEGPELEFVLSLCALLISLIAATLFYRLVEQPSLLLSRRLV